MITDIQILKGGNKVDWNQLEHAIHCLKGSNTIVDLFNHMLGIAMGRDRTRLLSARGGYHGPWLGIGVSPLYPPREREWEGEDIVE